ncbi:zinc-dependent alcohol dehydrogenase family protein [Hyalangium versicolor]|uniref:zinc-dependent alcohol dehydrogenase family protein n=1 Tax=Hyalangium versicolor TaxID=2861190 RepID=UPI001CCD119C|nr:NAD(P)-dependent alcohol dehydrogenase [Hyalangium versicolor]
MAETMKRWVIDAYGRKHLKLETVPIPRPGPREILVQARAVSLNYRDQQILEREAGHPLEFPFIPGSDLAGVVVEVGAEVTRFRTGDRVITTFVPGWIDGPRPGTARNPSYLTFGGVKQGVLAGYTVLHEDWAVASPATLTDAEASTLPVAGLTAWFALIHQGALRAGQTVVIQGTGGVALFGLQLARAHGAQVIITSSEEAKLERAKELGATWGIHRKTEDWVEAVWRITGDRGADHVLEIAGGANLGRSIQATAVGGHVWVIGVIEGWEVSGPVGPLILKTVNVHGIMTGHRRSLEELVRAIDRIGLKPVIDAEYPFASVPAAFNHLERGPFGKIVVRLD